MKLNRISEEARTLKNELKKIGEAAQKEAQESSGRLVAAVEERYENTEGKGKIGYVFPLVKKFVLAGVGIFLLFVIFVVIYDATMVRVQYGGPYEIPYSGSGIYEEAGSGTLSDGGVSRKIEMGGQEFSVEDFIGYSAAPPALAPVPTFKDRFLGALGRHEASPYEIAKRGPLLEKDLNVDIMTTKKKEETENFVQSAFQSVGGYVTQVNPCDHCGKRGGLRVYGKVPVNSLEGFRAMLKNFIGEDKYYREGITAQSRTADIIEIEKKIKEVEESVKYLEGAISRETDPTKKAELETKLADNKAFFVEREATKKAIEEKAEFVDVYLNATFLPTFFKASSFDDFKLLYIGFEQPTLMDEFKINATRITVFFLRILSYTFWLIPIIIWIWWKRRKEKGLFEELE